MKIQLLAIAAILALIPLAQSASAQSMPEWVKNNAGWWADGMISESEFVSAIQYLIKENIITIPPTQVSAQQSQGIPDWVKNTASWWSQGLISDGEFVNGIQHLISVGIITIDSGDAPSSEMSESKGAMSGTSDSELNRLQSDLQACSEIKKAYDRLNCERDAEQALTGYDYRINGQAFQVGPITYYYKGNDFEITSSGQAILNISIFAANTGSETTTLTCTSPQICNYDVWNGDKAFKYSGMDFTNGAIVLDPGQSREFSMLFGPNIGYGGTEFEYHEGKEYVFRVSESFGSVAIPLTLR